MGKSSSGKDTIYKRLMEQIAADENDRAVYDPSDQGGRNRRRGIFFAWMKIDWKSFVKQSGSSRLGLIIQSAGIWTYFYSGRWSDRAG